MTYTHGHHESVLRSHKWRTVDNSAAYLAPRLTCGISVLDLGCGPGTITADIGRRVAPGRVVGVDASADVIEEARRDAGGGPNIEFSVGDLYALDLDDHTFDVADMALCAALIHPGMSGPELNLTVGWLVWGTYTDDYFPAFYGHTRDMAGAKALGMRHVWVRSGDGRPCCPEDRVIAKLEELDGMLA